MLWRDALHRPAFGTAQRLTTKRFSEHWYWLGVHQHCTVWQLVLCVVSTFDRIVFVCSPPQVVQVHKHLVTASAANMDGWMVSRYLQAS